MENNITERPIPKNLDEEREAIEFILKETEDCKNRVQRKIISSVTERQIEDLII